MYYVVNLIYCKYNLFSWTCIINVCGDSDLLQVMLCT